MIGIDLQEDANLVKAWGLSLGLTYPLLLDSNRDVWNKFGMGYIPHNVVIDPDLIVRYTNYGYNQHTIINVIKAWLPTDVDEKLNRDDVPSNFQLFQNYPNPFNGETQISYYLAQDSQVSIKIFNLLGKEIKILVDETKASGRYTTLWDGRDNKGNDVASGIYIYSMRAGNFNETKKLSFLR